MTLTPEQIHLRQMDRELKQILALGEANALKLEQTRELGERAEQNAIEAARATRSAEAAAISSRHAAARSEQVVNVVRDEISEVNGKVSEMETVLDAKLMGIIEALAELLEGQRKLEVRQRNLESMLYGRVLPQQGVNTATTDKDAAASAEVGSNE